MCGVSMPTQDPENLIKALGEIINCFPYYVTIIDEERRIHYANEAICNAVNIDMKEIIGQYCNQVIHGLNKPPKECPLFQSIITDKPQVNEYYSEDRDSWYALEMYPLHIELNGKKMFLHMAQDISKNKKLEETMIREKKIGEFYLDLLTHDISNMVQPILSYLQMLNEIPDISMKYEKFIRIPLKETRRIAFLTKKVRMLSFIGSTPSIVIKVYLKEEIKKCVNEIKNEHPEKIINVEFTSESYLGPIYIVSEIVDQLLKMCKQITRLDDDQDINIYLTMILDRDEDKLYLVVTGDNKTFSNEFMEKYFDRSFNSILKKDRFGLDIAFFQELLRRLGGDIHFEPDLERKNHVKMVFTLPVEKINDE